jgi:hypothetical protein
MIKLLRSSLVLAGALTLSASLIAQAPAGAPGAPAGGGQRAPMPPPSNLKVLPKDISTDDLLKMMRGFTGALGVQCGFCHYVNPDTKRPDLASDANPVKNNARVMIAMTADINAKYLTTIANRKTTDPVSCGTCHRGEAHPSVFTPPPPAPRPPAATPPAQ